MTCEAYPSQWEGRLDDFHTFYARYRHGYFYLSVSQEYAGNSGDHTRSSILLEFEHDGESDGVMSTEEMKELTKNHVDWSEV